MTLRSRSNPHFYVFKRSRRRAVLVFSSVGVSSGLSGNVGSSDPARVVTGRGLVVPRVGARSLLILCRVL